MALDSRDLRVEVVRVSVLVGLYVLIVDSPLVLAHQHSKALPHLGFFRLLSQLFQVLLLLPLGFFLLEGV